MVNPEFSFCFIYDLQTSCEEDSAYTWAPFFFFFFLTSWFCLFFFFNVDNFSSLY